MNKETTRELCPLCGGNVECVKDDLFVVYDSITFCKSCSYVFEAIKKATK